jgi:two-component system, NtrC family, sensor kinase
MENGRDLEQRVAEDKLTTVGRLAGAVAHDINNPMTSILVFSESLMRKAQAGSAFREQADEIHQAALRCRDLVQALLRFARRPRDADPSSVPLAALVDRILILIRHRFDMARVTLELSVPTELSAVARASDLEHVLMDLLLLAVERASVGQQVRLSVQQLDATVQIEITITGLGREAPAPIAAARPVLDLCGDLLREMGGYLEVDDAEKGTWRVALPTADGAR